MRMCKNCDRPLNESQYDSEHKYKSCPCCSTINGTEHIFFPYPINFGTTDTRKSSGHPEGPQSYCTSHRGNPTNPIPAGGIHCSELKKTYI